MDQCRCYRCVDPSRDCNSQDGTIVVRYFWTSCFPIQPSSSSYSCALVTLATKARTQLSLFCSSLSRSTSQHAVQAPQVCPVMREARLLANTAGSVAHAFVSQACCSKHPVRILRSELLLSSQATPSRCTIGSTRATSLRRPKTPCWQP